MRKERPRVLNADDFIDYGDPNFPSLNNYFKNNKADNKRWEAAGYKPYSILSMVVGFFAIFYLLPLGIWEIAYLIKHGVY